MLGVAFGTRHVRTPLSRQDRRAWVDKPDGTIITLDDAKASAAGRHTRALTKAAPGVDYYEVLGVSSLQHPQLQLTAAQ